MHDSDELAIILRNLPKKMSQSIISAYKKSIRKPYVGQDECVKWHNTPTVKKVFADAKKRAKKMKYHREWKLSQETRMWEQAIASWQKYHNLHEYDLSDDGVMAVHIRDLSNLMYEIPPRWTGYTSEDALQSKNRVKEHFYPRRWAGHIIINYIIENKGITKEKFREFFEIFRQIHYTTQQENIKLKEFQEPEVFTDWKSAYEKAGVSKLIQVKDYGKIATYEKFIKND